MSIEMILCLSYLVSGVVLVVPYCFLAGWNAEIALTGIYMGPILVILLFFLSIIIGAIQRYGTKITFSFRPLITTSKDGVANVARFTFWVVISAILAPIVINGLYMIVGRNEILDFLYAHRYGALPFIIISAHLFLIFSETLKQFFKHPRQERG